MMNSPTIPLSDLRRLWRQAKWTWGLNCDGSPEDVFRRYVREEIARRTITDLRAQVERLTAELAEAKEQIHDLKVIVFLDYEQAIEPYRRTISAGNAAESE